MACNLVLPAVYTCNSMSKLTVRHIGTKKKKPLCGAKLHCVSLTDTRIKYDTDGELKERWFDALSNEGVWVKVFEHNYCKRCLASINCR